MKQLHAMPFEGQFIIYRPLARLAFVGNRAMVRCARQALESGSSGSPETDGFLRSVGFFDTCLPEDEGFFDGGGKTTPIPESSRALASCGFGGSHADSSADALPRCWPGGYRPTTATLLLTNQCNLRCTYCYAHGGEGRERQMPVEIARAAIDAVYQNAVALDRPSFSVTLHGGGEPTTSFRVLERAVAHARSVGLPCTISMSTNGVWTDRQRSWILDNLDEISLSCDGLPEIQDLQRPLADGSGSAASVLKTLRALDRASLPYGVRMTALESTFGRLAESVEFICSESCCSTIQIEPCYTGRRGDHGDPSREQAEVFARAFLDAFEVASRAGRACTYSAARPWVLTRTFCRSLSDALVVTPDGDIVTCFEVYDRRHRLFEQLAIGRIVDPLDPGEPSSKVGTRIGKAEGLTASVDEVRMRSVLEQHERRRSACRDCFCYWHCAGDCTVRWWPSEGRTPGRCHANRIITRELLAWYIAAGDGIWRGGGVDR